MATRNAFRAKRRKAIAAVEAAIVLPVLLTFVVGIIDLGRLAKVSNSLSSGARNGAQYGCASSSAAADSTRIRAAAVTEMANLPNVNSTNPSVSTSTVTHSGSSFVRVTLNYDLTGTSIFNIFPINSMSRTVEMQMMPQ